MCRSSGSVKWTLNDGPLPKSAAVVSNSLYIQKLGVKERGAYLCEGVDENGQPVWAISEVIILSE